MDPVKLAMTEVIFDVRQRPKELQSLEICPSLRQLKLYTFALYKVLSTGLLL